MSGSARAGTPEIDLTDRLRFAAGALASDLGDEITVDHAEALVFSSAERLLAAASVTEFVPILAERLARVAMRSGPPAGPAAPPPPPGPTVIVEAPGTPAVPPIMAVPEGDLAQIRERVERLRNRLAAWGPTAT